jgi:hypothetical protein
MTVQLVKTAKPITSTWLNRPGTLYTLHFDRSKFGKRVAVTFWRDNGEVELRAITVTPAVVGSYSSIGARCRQALPRTRPGPPPARWPSSTSPGCGYDHHLRPAAGRPAARDRLKLATVEDLLRLDAADIAWALEEHGRCDVLDASGQRELMIVAHRCA